MFLLSTKWLSEIVQTEIVPAKDRERRRRVFAPGSKFSSGSFTEPGKQLLHSQQGNRKWRKLVFYRQTESVTVCLNGQKNSEQDEDDLFYFFRAGSCQGCLPKPTFNP